MRIAGLIAATALVAACSQSVGGEAEPSDSVSTAPPSSTSSTPTTPPPTAAADRPPGDSAPIEEVIAWIEAGTATDPGAFHEAYLDGTITRLGDDIAFTAPSGASGETTQCLTDAAYNEGALTCLVELASPAPRPTGAEGMWKPGWIDYPGTNVQIGSLRGDPGPFIKGVGPLLADGQTLAFADNRCRSDAAGLFCVNYAHRSAVQISTDGVVPFGCLVSVPPPPQTGAMFSC
ncbi:Uncharacterised protein [Mycolicibacterium vanbaalenii]|uniref:LppI n=1 Tax=Mycolicibacterium vanbaalenii TaxID=110539 RepID=A0A5S9R7B4_MYCVN|nr:hypothetical protein [Mycolicibacterium vanbaalenii]CAA0134330.1 Uncharacterised protein [Mycolicibacterium vanbaalenii]